MKSLALISISLLLLVMGPAKAVVLNYDCAETNGSFTTDCGIGEAQFVTTVSDTGTGALFLFENIGSDQSTIANIYFDDTTGGILDFTDPGTSSTNSPFIDNSASGVQFGVGASPGDLPGAVSFDVSFASDADSPKPSNGINNEATSTGNEMLWITVDYSGSSTFAILLAALDAGTFELGLHAINYADGGSEWFTSTPSPVPVPAAFWLFGTALIGFIGMSRRTKV